jgi:hypothetical protein
VAAVSGGLVFALSGYVLEAATMVTRVLIATVVTLVGYTGLALAKARPGGAPLAAGVPSRPPPSPGPAEPSFVDAEPSLLTRTVEVVADAEPWLFAGEDVDPSSVDEYLEDAQDAEYVEPSLSTQTSICRCSTRTSPSSSTPSCRSSTSTPSTPRR